MAYKPLFAMAPLALAVSMISSNAAAAPGDEVAKPSAGTLEEVVVTAQRREQTLQEVPISVQVVTDDQLTQNNIASLSDIANITPGLSFGSAPEGASISMRGISTSVLGIGLESSTAIYLDGVYLGGGTALLGELQDLARIEVLRGPQGTLFGKNAAAGAISVTTAAPVETFGGSVTGGIGSDGLRYANTTVNAPISDTLLTRTNISRTVNDGVFGNASGGKRFGKADSISGRTRLTWLATDDLTVDLSLDATQGKGTRAPVIITKSGRTADSTYAANPGPINKISDTRFENTFVVFDAAGNAVKLDPGFGKTKSDGVALKLTWDLDDDLTLTSTTSHRSSYARGHSGPAGLVQSTFPTFAGGPLLAPSSGYISDTTEERKEFNQEFRLSGSWDYMDWFVGTNYSRNKNTSRDRMALPALRGTDLADVLSDGLSGLGVVSIGQGTPTGTFTDSGQDVNALLESVALFGDTIIPLTETVNVSLGARYSRDEVKVKWLEKQQNAQLFYANIGAGGIKKDDSWSNLSGRMVFDWTINDSVNTYAGVSQGYKSGGFNTSLANLDPSSFVPFKEEKSINYEVGVKSALLDNAMYLNASVYHTDYNDFQLQTVDPDDPLGQRSIITTADAFTRGIDMDITWLATERLTVGFNMALLKAEFKKTNKSVDKGQDLTRAPKFTASLNLDYVQPLELGDIRYNMTYSYSSKQRLTNQKLKDSNLAGSSLTLKESDLYSGNFDNLNARITFTPKGQQWEAALWATNLLDKAYRTDGHFGLTNSTFRQAGGVAAPYIRNAPRAVGVELSYAFGEL